MAQPVQPADGIPVFKQGTVVLAYHGPLLYEAIIGAIHRSPVLTYTVQYQGWSKSWDAQVPADHVLEHNDRNLAHAHSLLQSAKARQQAIVPVNEGRPYIMNDPMAVRTQMHTPTPYEKMPMHKHPARHAHVDSGEAVADTNVTDVNGTPQNLYANGTSDGHHLPGMLARPRTVEHENVMRRSRPTPTARDPQSSPSGEDDAEANVNDGTGTGREEAAGNDVCPSDAEEGSSLFHLPSSLKAQLVDDWEFITKEQRLVPIPREHTVEDIVDKWVIARESQEDASIQEVADAIKIYFDAALPTMLLYRFERLQYNTVFCYEKKSENDSEGRRRPARYYGAEHLVRLLLKMPYMLQKANVEEEMMQKIAEKTNDLARFIVDNGRTIFLRTYNQAPDSYIESVRNSISQPPPQESAVTPTDPAQEGTTGNTNGQEHENGHNDIDMHHAGEMLPENMSPVASNTTPTGRSTPGSSDRGVNGIAQSAH